MNVHRIGQVKRVEDNMSGARKISILKRQYYICVRFDFYVSYRC